jgi:hypothetical protein
MPSKPYLAMPGLIALLVAGALGCTASVLSQAPRADVVAPTADTIPRVPAAVDLTGGWTTGSTGEPDVPRIVLRPECNYHPATWLIQQHGDTLRAWSLPARRTQGVLTNQPVSAAGADGRISGVDLTLRMAGASYVLRYDSTSGHLRGTLNGAPFWAVRQEIIRPQGCIPPP